MITDALLAFIPIGGSLSLVGGAAQTFATRSIDILGQGEGQAPANFIGNASVFGSDMGVGQVMPELNVSVGTAVTSGTSTDCLKVALQAAEDTGADGGYLPGTWVDVVSQDNIPLTDLVAGAVIFRSRFLPTVPADFNPRFYRLLFSPQTVSGGVTDTPAGSFTAGTIGSALVTMVRDDQSNRFQAKNFTVA